MNIPAEQIKTYLEKNPRPLPAMVFIGGEEELLNLEALEIIRNKMREEGFQERQKLEQEHLLHLIQELNTPSLFSPQRVIEVHIQEKKLSKSTIEILKQLSQEHFDNTKVIIFAPNLEKITSQNWFKELFSSKNLAFVSTTLYPDAFAKHLKWRLQNANLHLTDAAYEQLLSHCFGNLLAAKQAIDRLMIHPIATGRIEEEQLLTLLNDCAQFNTFSFSQAILAAKWLEAYYIVLKLEAESPKDSTLITWLLQRDSTLLLALYNSNNKDYPYYFKQFNIYKTQQARYLYALKIYHPNILLSLLRLAAKLDRIIKGDEYGDFWLTLSQYLLLRARS